MHVSPDVLASRNARLPEDHDPQETTEWLDAMEAVLQYGGPERAQYLLESLIARVAKSSRTPLIGAITTPYVNTHPGRRSNPRSPATANSNGASRASSAGTRWRWC